MLQLAELSKPVNTNLYGLNSFKMAPFRAPGTFVLNYGQKCEYDSSFII